MPSSAATVVEGLHTVRVAGGRRSREAGIPAVTVAGPGFVQLAQLTGTSNAIPSLQVAVCPGPFDLHTDEVLRQNAEKELVPQIVKALTGKIEATATVRRRGTREKIVFSGTLEEINRYFSDVGWSDGAAIVPPTPDKSGGIPEVHGLRAG